MELNLVRISGVEPSVEIVRLHLLEKTRDDCVVTRAQPRTTGRTRPSTVLEAKETGTGPEVSGRDLHRFCMCL